MFHKDMFSFVLDVGMVAIHHGLVCLRWAVCSCIEKQRGVEPLGVFFFFGSVKSYYQIQCSGWGCFLTQPKFGFLSAAVQMRCCFSPCASDGAAWLGFILWHLVSLQETAQNLTPHFVCACGLSSAFAHATATMTAQSSMNKWIVSNPKLYYILNISKWFGYFKWTGKYIMFLTGNIWSWSFALRQHHYFFQQEFLAQRKKK